VYWKKANVPETAHTRHIKLEQMTSITTTVSNGKIRNLVRAHLSNPKKGLITNEDYNFLKTAGTMLWLVSVRFLADVCVNEKNYETTRQPNNQWLAFAGKGSL
jgi:hypothetical protein